MEKASIPMRPTTGDSRHDERHGIRLVAPRLLFRNIRRRQVTSRPGGGKSRLKGEWSRRKKSATFATKFPSDNHRCPVKSSQHAQFKTSLASRENHRFCHDANQHTPAKIPKTSIRASEK